MKSNSKTQVSNHARKTPELPIEWASDIQLSRRYAVSRATIWRWANSGIIPPPVKVGPNVTRWHLTEVIAKLEAAA
jgi:prophage regulatory protein